MKTNEVNKEISYETLLVTFGEGIGRLDTMFDDPQVWGVATLKQWIDGYETTRFTEIDDRTAVITSEYNMDSVKEWLQKNTHRLSTWKNDKIMRKYKLFIGYRLLGEFSGIWEAKNFAAESGMSGIFSLVGENYRDSWYEPKKQDKNGNKD